MDFEYLDQKRLLGGVMPDNTVTKVITRGKFFLGGEVGQPEMLRNSKVVFFGSILGNPSKPWLPVVSLAPYNADQTDRLSLKPCGAPWPMSKHKNQPL